MFKDIVWNNAKKQMKLNKVYSSFIKFKFTTNSERVIELEKNEKIDKILKHKNFVFIY
jgi:hypothetical protein